MAQSHKDFCQRGREVFLFANGNLKKVASCKVKPFKVEKIENNSGNEDKEHKSRSVSFEEDKRKLTRIYLWDREGDGWNLLDESRE